VAKQKADPNGYFKVETDYGIAYIKASKLNEAMEEAFDTGATAEEARFPEINDIELYQEALFRE
jgi:hypothetical protein